MRNRAMRKLAPLIAAGLAALSAAAPAASPDREEQLERALRGRVAGEPVSCIDMHRVTGSTIIPDTAVIYDAGSVLYVNRPDSGAESLDRWDILVTRLYTSQLCNTDTVDLIDQGSHAYSGTLFLGDFVPYRRIRTSDAR
jgi:hypothetical protein